MQDFWGWFIVILLGISIVIDIIVILLAFLGYEEPYEFVCDLGKTIFDKYLHITLVVLLLSVIIGIFMFVPLDSTKQYIVVIAAFLIFATPYFLVLSKHYKLATVFFAISFIISLLLECG